MKIAQIAPPWIAVPPKNYGGTEMVIYSLVEEQVAQGHDVTLFAPGDAKTSAKHISFFPHSLIEEGVPWQSHLKAYYHLHCAIKYIEEHTYDVIHTHLSSSADLYVLPLTAALATPHVTTLHCRFPFDTMPDGWQGDADCYYMKWVPYVPMVAISESARAQEKFPLNFVGMVHHGLPMKLFRPLGNRRGDFFVWLGRFVPKKGAHIAVEAAKQAEVPIVLAGTMDLYDQGSIQYFYRVIEPLIDGKQVKYIGPVNMKQKIELLSYARGLLNPINLEEPFGLVMIEAMALGCPVIAFARGAAPELIIHGKTGFLAQNIDEIVYFISRIDEIDRDLTRRHVQNNFSACAMAKKYVKIYEKVIQIDKESPVPMERVKVHDQ